MKDLSVISSEEELIRTELQRLVSALSNQGVTVVNLKIDLTIEKDGELYKMQQNYGRKTH